MSTLALLLIIISAVMHAFWNLLVKRSRDKTVFIWWMFIASGLLMNLALPFAGSFPPMDARLFGLVVAGSACFVLYHLFNGRAYRSGDLSLTYPLSQTSMLWVPLWGALILDERFTWPGVAGIALIIAGVWCVQLRALAWREAIRPLRNLGDPAVQAALAAGFIYSIGSIIDKTGVTGYDPFHFTYLLVVCMFLLMSLNLARPRYHGRILAEWRHSRALILLSGPVMMGSFMTFRYGLKLAPVSYAVPVRQVSILVGVLIGTLFLGEECGRIRVVAALLILVGVALIRLG
ncbi:MAG: EamA family transporter [Desulfuromonadales bacterium]|nr:EamA family transporter [Desulfuromonadales bacterium]